MRHVAAEPWDLLITGIEMPGMTRLELLHQVRLIDPALPVAVVTAHGARGSGGKQDILLPAVSRGERQLPAAVRAWTRRLRR